MENAKPIPRSDAKFYAIPGGDCWLYPDCPTGRLSCAYVESTGRYPEKGFRKNLRCTESMFVIEGEFRIWVGGQEFPLRQHDLFYVPVGTPYALEGTGKTLVFIEPKWDSAQNVQVD